MKILKILLLSIIVVFLTTTLGIATDTYTNTIILIDVGSDIMYVNGISVNIEIPYITNNNTIMVPVRAIAENLGANVEWYGGKNCGVEIEYYCDEIPVTLYYSINDSEAIENHKPYMMDEKAVVNINGITMVPIESIAHFFGAEIEKNETGHVKLSRKLYYIHGNQYFTSSQFSWSMIIPKEKVDALYREEGCEQVSFNVPGNLFFVTVCDTNYKESTNQYYFWKSPSEFNNSQEKYYDGLLKNLNSKYGVAEKCIDDYGNEYIRYEDCEEGYLVMYIYLKDNMYYEISSITEKKAESDYYENIMKTFLPEVKLGDDVIDLSELNNITNLLYD